MSTVTEQTEQHTKGKQKKKSLNETIGTQTSLCFHKSGMSGTKIADRLGFSRHMKTGRTLTRFFLLLNCYKCFVNCSVDVEPKQVTVETKCCGFLTVHLFLPD